MLPSQERLTADVQFLAADGEDSGQFEMLAYTGATVQRFFGPAVFDLAGMDAPAKLPILSEHNGGDIVGHADTISITEAGGVKLAGPVYAGEDAGGRVRRLSRLGFPWKASIGVNVARWQELDTGESAVVNNRTVTGPISIARQSRLFETSFVVNPADSGTDAEAMKEQTMAKKTTETTETLEAPDVEKLTADARADGAKSTREELKTFLAAFPEARRAWAAGRFAENLSLVEAKAELSDVLQIELDKAHELANKSTLKIGERSNVLEELEGQAAHPGVGFSAEDRQAGKQTENLSALPYADRVERLWAMPKIKAEFGSRGAFEAIAKREGVSQFETENASA